MRGLSKVAWALLAVVTSWLLLRLPLLWAAVGVGGLWLLLAWFVEPLLGLGSALFVAPWGAYLAAYLPQIPHRLGDLLLATTAFLVLLDGLAHRLRRWPLPLRVGWWLFPLLAFVPSLWSPLEPQMAFLEAMKWVEMVLCIVLVWMRIAPHGELEVRRVVLALGLVAALLLFQAVVGLWQFALRGEGPEAFLIREGFYRAYGTFEQPNPFGGLMGMGAALFTGLTLGLGLDASRRHRRWALLSGSIAGVCAAALIASWSRGAWMGFAAALLVMGAALFLRKIRGGRWWRWAAFGLVLTLAVGGALLRRVSLPSLLAERLVGFLAYTRFQDVRGVPITGENFSIIERMAHWQAALAMWRDHFWSGVGLGNYEAAYPDYALINWALPLGHAHNFYLTLLAEVGLLGLGGYLLFLILLLVPLWRVARKDGGWRGALALGLLGLWVHLLVHDIVDNLMVNGVQMVLGLSLALAAGVVSWREEGVISRSHSGGWSILG